MEFLILPMVILTVQQLIVNCHRFLDIDKLEKTKMDVKRFSKRYEAYQPFALAAVLVLLLDILLRTTYLRRIP